jgi:hypothetical protein
MAETPVRMNGHGKNGHSPGPPASSTDDPQERAARLEREAEQIREHLDGLLGELDRRRHAATDLTKQIGRYLIPAAISAVALGATIWAAVALLRRRRAHNRRLVTRASVLSRRLATAIGDLDTRDVRKLLPW